MGKIKKQTHEYMVNNTTLKAANAQYQQSLQDILQKQSTNYELELQKERNAFQNQIQNERDDNHDQLQRERGSHEKERLSFIEKNSILKMEKDGIAALCNKQKEEIKGLCEHVDNVEAKYRVLQEQ